MLTDLLVESLRQMVRTHTASYTPEPIKVMVAEIAYNYSPITLTITRFRRLPSHSP